MARHSLAKPPAAKSTQFAKVLWAFDPFLKPMADMTPWSHFLDRLARLEKSKIEPVYVLSPDGLNWSGEFSGPWVKKYGPLAEAAAQPVLAPYQDKSIKPLRILVNQKLSLRGDVAKLANHAKRHKADLIVVQTHGRKGLERFFLGSFAETLLQESKVPVLSINPNTTPPKEIRRVLFPTDLSVESKKTFKKLLSRCHAWGTELILLHKLPDPIEPIVQSGVYMAGGGWITLSQYFAKESAESRRKLEAWVKEGKAAKVEVSVEVVEKPGLVADAILDYAKKTNADMIAMLTHSGPISSVLVGSVARQIVRAAHCPVLVFH
jgi:nucleotide-binding universal stress UspA family protein